MPDQLRVQPLRPQVRMTVRARALNGELVDCTADLVALTVERAINQPTGAWSAVLVSRRDAQGHTWAQRVRPMDYVELRFGHHVPPGQDPPLILRGFVDQCRESWVMAGDRPQRQVILAGRDFGKLLLVTTVATAIVGLPGVAQEQAARLQARLQELLLTGPLSPADYLQRIEEAILYPDDAGGIGPPQGSLVGLPRFRLVIRDIDQLGQVIAPGLVRYTGPLWTLIQGFVSPPVGEVIVQDAPDRPELVWRWAPFHDAQGRLIPPVEQDDPPIEISTASIMQADLATSDNEVFSYFFASPTTKGAESFSPLVAADPHGEGNPRHRPDLADRYGFRMLDVEFRVWPWAALPPSESDSDYQQAALDWQRHGALVAAWLEAAFGHAAQLEAGELVLRGDARIRPGRYLLVRETQQEFYVESVRHHLQLAPVPQFTTTCAVTRGLYLRQSPYPSDAPEAGPPGRGTDRWRTGPALDVLPEGF